MKRIITLLSAAMLCLVLMTACKSTQQATTSVTYPEWLQLQMKVLNDRHSEITLFELDGAPYYAVFVKGPDKSFDMNRTTIYDTNGNVYLTLGGPRRPNEKELNFFQNADNKGVIWMSDIAREKSNSLPVMP